MKIPHDYHQCEAKTNKGIRCKSFNYTEYDCTDNTWKCPKHHPDALARKKRRDSGVEPPIPFWTYNAVSAAFEAGKKARAAGVSRLDNPMYNRSLRGEWEQGWDSYTPPVSEQEHTT